MKSVLLRFLEQRFALIFHGIDFLISPRRLHAENQGKLTWACPAPMHMQEAFLER